MPIYIYKTGKPSSHLHIAGNPMNLGELSHSKEVRENGTIDLNEKDLQKDDIKKLIAENKLIPVEPPESAGKTEEKKEVKMFEDIPKEDKPRRKKKKKE